jgi:hypothetical protein
MMKRAQASLLSLFIVCLLSPAPSRSQQPAQRLLAIKAARALDAQAGAMIDNAVIIIEGDRVKTIGANPRVSRSHVVSASYEFNPRLGLS